MAATSKNVTPSFDINAYLASTAERKTFSERLGSILSSGAEKLERATENLSHKLSYSVGDGVGASDGLVDVYELGRKVGVIRSKVRTEAFRARAEEKIRKLLAQA
jgi:hypothetical protein